MDEMGSWCHVILEASKHAHHVVFYNGPSMKFGRLFVMYKTKQKEASLTGQKASQHHIFQLLSFVPDFAPVPGYVSHKVLVFDWEHLC
mmetsp:Transcript_6641/g.8964  ORF Transcript_6641/g.8964 Transcript_6641/m.8964 type:complete len:88 (-) Transcript_6641:902-1165(-)